MSEEWIKCPKCGHANPKSASDCNGCGITFRIYRAERERIRSVDPLKMTGSGEGKDTGSDGLTGCPNCGHPTDLSSQDCLKCGIVFSKYFEIQERSLAEDPEKLAELHRLREIHDKAVKRRQEKENQERQAAAARLQADRVRAEALKKLRLQQEEADALRKRIAETETIEALKRLHEAFERDQEERRRRAEAEKSETLKSQQEALEAAALQQQERRGQELREALENQKAVFEKGQALLDQQEEKKKAEALRMQMQEFEKAEAQRLRRMEEAVREALRNQGEDLEKNRVLAESQRIRERLAQRASLAERLQPYRGQTIWIMSVAAVSGTSGKWLPGVLLDVSTDHFSVWFPERGTLSSHPFAAVACVAENPDGFSIGESADRAYLTVTVTAVS